MSNYDSARKKDLVFFYSHENCPARATALPVLAWLAEQNGMDYDGYFCVKPSVADIGDALPFTGNKHDQQFQFVANFYDQIYLLALTGEDPIQFESFVRGRGHSTILKEPAARLVDFYFKIFQIMETQIPMVAVIFPAAKLPFPNEKIVLGDFVIPGESRLDTFCYPEIFFRQALGLFLELPDTEIQRLIAAGLEKIYLLYCPATARTRFEKLGLEVEMVDEIQPEDNYATLTARIVERWIEHGRGLALGNDPITLRWTPKYLRDRILPQSGLQSLPQAIEFLGKFTQKIGNNLVWGSQIFNDHIFADAAKHDIIFSLVHDIEVGITIREKIKLPNTWLQHAPAPWEAEFSDEFLSQQLVAGKIPVCFLHYASDLGHLPVLPRHLDLHSIDGIRDGIAFPASWWPFASEQLEQFYLSKEMGGVFPTLEPLISSAGLGVATEAKGYLSPEAYLHALQQARQIITEFAGQKHVPLGHYAFQDACPHYQHNTAEPDFDVLVAAGFDYAVTYKHEGDYPQIVFAKDNFIAINQQNIHWTFDPMPVLREWELKLVHEQHPGWILLGLDSPFWGMVPCYFGLASKGLSLADLQKTMTYARDGGDSGRLFLVKPHELARIARMLRAQKKI